MLFPRQARRIIAVTLFIALIAASVAVASAYAHRVSTLHAQAATPNA